MLQTALLSLLLLPTPRSHPTGQDLLTVCKFYTGGDDLDERTFPCVIYFAGLMDAIVNYEFVIEMTASFDVIGHMTLLASAGGLPSETIRRLEQDSKRTDSFAATAASILKTNSEALAKRGGTPKPPTESVNFKSPSLRMICFPEGSGSGQVALVVLKYLRDHPERLHESRAFLAFEALKSAFPCTND